MTRRLSTSQCAVVLVVESEVEDENRLCVSWGLACASWHDLGRRAVWGGKCVAGACALWARWEGLRQASGSVGARTVVQAL